MQHNTMGYKTIKFNTTILIYPKSESEKDGEPRKQVPEEGWYETLNISHNSWMQFLQNLAFFNKCCKVIHGKIIIKVYVFNIFMETIIWFIAKVTIICETMCEEGSESKFGSEEGWNVFLTPSTTTMFETDLGCW